MIQSKNELLCYCAPSLFIVHTLGALTDMAFFFRACFYMSEMVIVRPASHRGFETLLN